MKSHTAALIELFREDQSDYFDENGKAYNPAGVGFSHNKANEMLIVINELEKEAEYMVPIMRQIYIAMEKLGATSDLLGIIGSFQDTVDNKTILDDLTRVNS